jgi:hypothetical protein
MCKVKVLRLLNKCRRVKMFLNEGVLRLQTFLQTYIKVSLLVYGHPKMHSTPKYELKLKGTTYTCKINVIFPVD